METDVMTEFLVAFLWNFSSDKYFNVLTLLKYDCNQVKLGKKKMQKMNNSLVWPPNHGP